MGREIAVGRAPAIAKALVAGCIAAAAVVTASPGLAEDLQNSQSAEPHAGRPAGAAAAERGHLSRSRRQHSRPAASRQPTRAAAAARDARAGPAAGEKSEPDRPKPDLTGQKRFGIASFYADNFGGKPMADGAPMDLEGDNAASRTLPLGTRAKVTNLETGKSATVVIEDRGPYVEGRIVDLSPATARKIGITQRKGVSKVVVAPITVPQPNGTVKLGAAGRENRGIREASAGTTASTR